MFRRRILYPTTIKHKIVVTCESKTYNAQVQVATDVSVVMSGKTLVEGVDYEIIENEGGITVGSYTFVVKGIGKYSDFQQGTFSITKVTPTVTIPTPRTNVVYDGTPKALINGGSTDFGTLKYSLDGDSYSTTIPTGINATSYTVYYKVDGDGININDVAPQQITCVINPAQCCSTAPTAINGIVYDGTSKALINAGSSSCGTMQYNVDGGDYSTSIPSGINAKTDYTVGWKVINDSNHSGTCSGTVSVNIAKANGSVTTAPSSIPSLVYNASAQALVTAGNGTGTMMYKLDSGSWGTSIPTATNATSYTVYYKASASTNYNESASGSVSCSIGKVTPTVTAPTAKSGLVYSGSEQALVNAGSTNWGTLKYSLDNNTYSTSIPSGTNATSYTIYYRVDGNSNINNVAAQSISNSIAKADTTYVAPTAKSLTYNGSAQALLNAGAVTGGTMQYSSDNANWSTSVPSGTNANNYSSYWRIVGDSNHNDKASVSITTTISKANGNVSTAPTAKSLTYNASSQELVTAGSGTGTMMYKLDSGSWGTSIPTAVNATSYTVYYKASASTNYNESASGSVSCSIGKVTPTVTAPTAKVLTFNNANQVLANAGSTNYGTMQYCLNNSGGTYSNTVPSASAANVTYKVWYKVVGDNNINNVNPASIDCMIAEKRVTTPTITLDPTGYTYNGSERKPTPTVKDGSTVIPSSEYTVGYSNNTNAGTATVTISDVNLGNYYISGTTTFTISKANGSVSTAPTAKSLTYNGSAQALVTAGSGTGTMMYKLDSGSWGTSIPTATNATSYTVYYKASASTNYNESASGSVSCSIGKVTPTVTAPTAKSLTYNGSAQQLANAGSANWGTLQYSLDNSSWDTSVPSGTNATSYTVYYRVSGNTNINSVAAKSISCSIGKANTTYTAPTAKNTTYNTSAQALLNAGAVTGGTIYYSADNSNWGTTIPSQTNAGTYTSYWKITGDSNHNDKASASISTTISAKTVSSPTITLSQTSYTYSNSACQPTPTVKDGSTTIASSEYSVSYSNNTNVGTATCTITDKSGGNYTVSGSKTFTIVCKSCTAPTAKNGNWTGSAQALVNAGSTSYGTMVYSTDNSTWSTNIPNGTNAGSYTVFWKVTGNTNVCCTASSSVACSIKKVAMTYTAPSATTYTYANTARNSASGGSATGGSIQYCTTSGGTYSTTIPTNTNVGSYDVWWKSVPDSNHSGGTSAAKLTAKINCYSATAPTAKNGNWSGSAQNLVNAGSTSYGTMVYCSTSGGTYSTTIPQGTNAGSYEVWWKVTGNTNVCNTAATKVACSIKQVAMTYTAPKAAVRTYNGSAQQIVSGQSAAGGSIYYATSSAGASSSTTVPTQTNVGSYNTWWKAVPDSNHSGGTSSWAQLTGTINKAAMTYTAPSAATRTYNGTAQQIVSGQSAAGGSIYYATSNAGASSSTTVPTATNTGTSYSTYWKAIPDSNHSGGTSSWTQITGCKINQAALTITAKAQTVNYGTAITTGTSQVTTSGLVGGDSLTAITLTPSTSNVPGGTITPSAGATSKGIGNYSVTYSTGTLTINKVSCCSTAPTTKSLTYNGNAQALVNAGSSSCGTMQYATATTATYGASIPSGTTAGSYTTYWKVSNDGNHSGTCSGSVSTTISKANISPTVSISNWTYGGTASNPSVAGNSGSGSVVYYYKVSGAADSTYTTTKPSNAGSYTIKANISATTNYNSGTCTNNFTINKAAISCTAPTNKGVTYNRGSQALANAGSVVGGSMTYCSTSGGTYSANMPTGTNAGSYTVWYKGTPDSNHSGSCSGSVACTIVKATPVTATSPTWVAGWTYDGSAHNLLSGGTMKHSSSDSTSVGGSFTYTKATNAGTYTAATWTFTPNASYSGNYNSTSATITKANAVVVAQAACCSTAPTAKSLTYNRSAQALVNAGSSSCGTMQYATATTATYSTTIPTQTNAGTYTTYWKVVCSGNYSGTSSGSVSTTIAKATPVLSTAPTFVSNWTYDATAHNLLSGGAMKHSSSDSTAVGGSFTYTTAINAGKYGSATWTFTPNSSYSGNYKGNSGTITSGGTVTGVTVSAKAISNVTITLSPTSFTYSGSAQKPSTITVKSGTSALTVNTHYTLSYSNSSSTNAGSYSVSAVATSNYSFTTVSASYSISCAGYTAPTKKTLTYNGSAQALANAGSVSNSTYQTLKYATASTATYSTSIPTGTNKGDYPVYWKVESTSSNYCTGNGSFTSSITCLTPLITAAPSPRTGLVYNGSAQALLSGGTANVGGSFSYDSGTNAGSYNAKWTFTPSNNNYCTVTGSATTSIAKAAMTYTAPKAAVRTYNGSAQQIVSGASATGGSIYYATSSGGTSSSTTVPSKTDAGSYSTWWKAVVTATTNYSGGTSSWVKLTGTINCVGYTAPKKTTYTYDGNAKPLVSGASMSNTAQTITYSTASTGTYSANVPSATNAGSYTVYYKVASTSTNYCSGSSSVSCSIAKKTGCTISFATTAITRTYGWPGGSNAATNNGDSTITWSSNNTGVCSVNSSGQLTINSTGSCTITAAVANTSNCTYSTTAATYTVTVNKGEGSVTKAPTNKGVTYNGSSQELINAGTGTGTMLYYGGSNTSWSTTIPKATTAGTYTISYKASASTLYNESASGSVSTTIAKAACCSTAPTTKSLTYNGSSQALINAGSSSCGTMQYSGGTNSTTWSTTIPSGTNAGNYTVGWKVVNDDNHSGTCSGNVTATISCVGYAAPATKSLTYNGTNCQNNGTSQELMTAGSVGNSTYQKIYYGTTPSTITATTVPTQTNAGTYASYWRVSASTTNYCSGSGTVTTTIAKKASSVCTSPTSRGVMYNGSAQQLVTPGSGTGTMLYSLDGTNFSSSIPTGTNATSYTVYYKASASTNYNESNRYTMTAYIYCAKYVAPTPKSLTYNGSAQVLVNAGTITSSAYQTLQYSLNNSTWSSSIPTGTTAGTYTVYWKVTSTSTNYCSGSGSVSTTIAKAAMSYCTPKAVSKTCNGSSQQIVSGTCTATGGSVYYATASTGAGSATTIPTKSSPGTYNIWWKAVVTNSNYSGGTSSWAQITSTISKGTGNVSTAPANNNPTYGSAGYLCTAGSGTGTMMYKVGTDAWSSSRPQTSVRNAGTYTVYYKASASTCYNESASGSVSCTIAKANGSVHTAPTAKNPCWTGSMQQLVTAGSGTGTMLYKVAQSTTWSTSIPAATSVGGYLVNYKASASTNYNESSSGSVSCVIDFPYVDLGLSVYWGKWNIGSVTESASTANTTYYSIGRGTQTYSQTSGMSVYTSSESGGLLPASVDTAHLTCVLDGTWHIPTEAQFNELTANTNFSWVYDGTTYFAKFANKSDSSKFILFPSVGYYQAGTKKEGASYVWTATNNSGAYKQFKIQYNGCVVEGGNPTINYGFPVRGVKNKS